MHRLLIASALVVAALAGCIGGPSQAPGSLADDDPALNVTAYAEPRLVQDHDHLEDHQAHAGRAGLDHVAFEPARDSYPDSELYDYLAVRGDHAYVTFGPGGGFVNPGDQAGFFIYDISDPTDPERVGTWLGQPLADVEVSDDGQYVFAPTQRNGYPYPYTAHPDAGADGHAPRGTYIVDISDKANPETVNFVPLPTNGPHTLTYDRHPDGTEILLQSTYDILFTAYPQDVGQNVLTQKVVVTSFDRDAETLVPHSTFQLPVDDVGEATRFPHDTSVHVDPDDGRLIMNVAYWDIGYVTVDITDLSQPEELDRFRDVAPSDEVNTHLVRVFPGLIDDKTVAIMEPEIPTSDGVGQFTFVDASDPEDLRKLGWWSLPGDHTIDVPFIFSPHNFDPACGGQGQPQADAEDYGEPCEDPTVALSHFHGGLWTLDASDPTDPQATGFFFPNVTRSSFGEGFAYTGFLDVFVKDGRIFAPEVWTGLHVLEPGGSR